MAERAPRESTRSFRFGGRAIPYLWVSFLAVLFTLPAFGQESDLGVADQELVLPSALAQFTTAVENREPVDQVTFVANDARQIFFFSDLRGMSGQTVLHRWVFKGETVAEVPFAVGGPRWRVWSSKELLEEWIGDWTVEIVSEEGEVIAAETFTYSPKGS